MKRIAGLAAALAAIALSPTTSPADWEIGFADSSGNRITELHVPEGPFEVYLAAFSFSPPEGLTVDQYLAELYYESEQLTVSGYQDQRDWPATVTESWPGFQQMAADGEGDSAAFDDAFVFGRFQLETGIAGDTGEEGEGEEEDGGPDTSLSADAEIFDGSALHGPSDGYSLDVYFDGAAPETATHVWTLANGNEDFTDASNWRQPGIGAAPPHPDGAPGAASEVLFEYGEGDSTAWLDPFRTTVAAMTFRGGDGSDFSTGVRDFTIAEYFAPLDVSGSFIVEGGCKVLLDMSTSPTIGGDILVRDPNGLSFLEVSTGTDWAAMKAQNLILSEGASPDNRNRVQVAGGQLTIQQTATVQASAAIMVDPGCVFQAGTLEMQTGSRADINGEANITDLILDGGSQVHVGRLDAGAVLTSGTSGALWGVVNVWGRWDAGGSNPQATWGAVNLYGGEVHCANLQLRGGDSSPGLTGSGTIAGDLTNDAQVSPGESAGAIHVTGDYVQEYYFGGSAGHLLIEIDSGTSYDRLIVDGSAHLGWDAGNGDVGTALSLLFGAGLTLTEGMEMTILDVGGTTRGHFRVWDDAQSQWVHYYNDGSDSIVHSADGLDLYLTYTGGEGNDVVLYTVPEPASAAMALLGLLAGALPVRRRPGKAGRT